MLKKENRLNADFAFNLTYKNRNIVSTPTMILYAGRLKQDKNCPTRVGFVVSKKVHKRAVKRNRIKRLMRENIRLILMDKIKQDEERQLNNQLNNIKEAQTIKTEYKQIINNYQSLIFSAKDTILEEVSFTEIKNTIEILLKNLKNKQNNNANK